MRKMLVVALVVGLLGGSLVGPVEAKKKKKKTLTPVAVTYWFTNDTDGCEPEAYLLKLTEATEGTNCGSLFYGATYEEAVAAGEAPENITYNASEGVPFVLDATQKITGTIQVASKSTAGGVPLWLGAGEATTKGVINGTTGDESVELGSFESTYQVTPATGVYEVKFEIEAPAEFDKAEFTGLSISLHTVGNSVAHGYYKVHSPASSFTVPTWQ